MSHRVSVDRYRLMMTITRQYFFDCSWSRRIFRLISAIASSPLGLPFSFSFHAYLNPISPPPNNRFLPSLLLPVSTFFFLPSFSHFSYFSFFPFYPLSDVPVTIPSSNQNRDKKLSEVSRRKTKEKAYLQPLRTTYFFSSFLHLHKYTTIYIHHIYICICIYIFVYVYIHMLNVYIYTYIYLYASINI